MAEKHKPSTLADFSPTGHIVLSHVAYLFSFRSTCTHWNLLSLVANITVTTVAEMDKPPMLADFSSTVIFLL